MIVLQNYYEKVVKYDFINKFFYSDLNKIPKLKKVILFLKYKKFNLKQIKFGLVAIELITTKPVFLTKSKRSDIFLKVLKNQPINYIIALQKHQIYSFIFKLLIEVLSNFKIYNYSFVLFKTFLTFKEFEKHFYLFADLPRLKIILATNTNNDKELLYLFSSFKLVDQS